MTTTQRHRTRTRTALAALAALATLAQPAPAAARSAPSWALDRVDQRQLPLDGAFTPEAAGAGVTVYVIDSGVRSDHAEFAGRLAPGYNALDPGAPPEDCNGHGTHVAGIAAGATYGVAPGAVVVPVKVFDCSGAGYGSVVRAGVEWIIEHHQPGVPAVANISVAGGLSNSLNGAIAAAVADGIVFVAAAGNSNSDACAYSPGAAPAALTVGSTDSNDARSKFSNYGACVDIFAPGNPVTSAWSTSPTATRSLSGTSQAAPLVAGAAALLLSRQPELSPAQVSERLLGDATLDLVTNPGPSSPNRLLFVAPPAPPPAPTTTTTTTTLPPAPPADDGANARQDGVRLAVRLYRSPNEVAVYSRPFTNVEVRATPAAGEVLTWVVRTNSVGYTKFSTRRNLAAYDVSARINP